MHRLLPLLFCAAVFAPLPVEVAGQGDPVAAEVEAREIAFARTMADRDFDAFLSFVSPEAGRFNSIWRKDADGQWRVVFDKGS